MEQDNFIGVFLFFFMATAFILEFILEPKKEHKATPVSQLDASDYGNYRYWKYFKRMWK